MHWLVPSFVFNSIWLLFLSAKKGSKALVPGSSCKDILISGDAEGDGEYWIDPTASGDPFRVFCDMVTDGGKEAMDVLLTNIKLTNITFLDIIYRLSQ